MRASSRRAGLSPLSLARLGPRLRCNFSSINVKYASSAPAPSSKTIFSGIQPTGIPHLGNYLGALSNWVKLQDSAQHEDRLIFSVVGWHALTLPQDPKELAKTRIETIAVLLAIGLDPKRSIIFHQDENPDHTDLAWLLSCATSMGKLRRMTTWKSRLAVSRNANDESEVDDTLLNAGLFTYPILQAADILAYQATHVPVGEDQRQHLELCRDLAESFNKTYKKPYFPLPQDIITPSKRVLSLRDPTSKMSKSASDPASRILLTDTPTQISKKLKSAVTDSHPTISYDPIQRPGTSNLLTILAAILDEEPAVVGERYATKGVGLKELKEDVTDAVVGLFDGPRREYEKIRGDEAYLRQLARDGAARSRGITGGVMENVRGIIGLPRC